MNRGEVRAIAGVLVIAAGVVVGVYGFSADLTINNAVTITFVGGFVIFLGIVVFGPLIARPLSSVIGRPLKPGLGVTGTLARGNAMRNPRRTSATAAALIVGLALVTLVAIFADSVKTSVRGALERRACGLHPDGAAVCRLLARGRDPRRATSRASRPRSGSDGAMSGSTTTTRR